jgi:hypothetical protein
MWEKFQERDVDDVRICQKILCAITLAFRPLHLKEIQAIIEEIELEDLEICRELIETCGYFVTIRDDVVYFIHQSAKDYFATGTGLKIFSSHATTHEQMAQRCVGLMTKYLNRNICGLAHPGVLVHEVPKSILDQKIRRIQYSCQYWLRHLRAHLNSQGSSHQLDDGGCVHMFLQSNLLYWLEILGLTKKMSEGIFDILELLQILSVSTYQS